MVFGHAAVFISWTINILYAFTKEYKILKYIVIIVMCVEYCRSYIRTKYNRREDWKGMIIMIKHLITKKLCKVNTEELYKLLFMKIVRENKKGKNPSWF